MISDIILLKKHIQCFSEQDRFSDQDARKERKAEQDHQMRRLKNIILHLWFQHIIVPSWHNPYPRPSCRA